MEGDIGCQGPQLEDEFCNGHVICLALVILIHIISMREIVRPVRIIPNGLLMESALLPVTAGYVHEIENV